MAYIFTSKNINSPSLSPSLLIGPWYVEYVSGVLFCYILDAMLCYVWKNKIKIVDNKKKNINTDISLARV